MATKKQDAVLVESVEPLILSLRKEQVMLDADLARGFRPNGLTNRSKEMPTDFRLTLFLG